MDTGTEDTGIIEETQDVFEAQSLGDLLVEAGLITQRQIEYALDIQKTQGKKLGEILVEQRFITPEDLTAMLSVQINVPFIDLKRHILQPHAMEMISEWMARKYNVVPLDVVNDTLVLVMENPEDTQAINDLTAHAGIQIQPAIGIAEDIREAIDLNYQSKGEIEDEIHRIYPSFAATGKVEAGAGLDITAGTPVVRAVDLLIGQAVRARASDIHFEPQSDRLRVRYRIDGIMQEFMSLPMEIHPALVSRIKILGGMNIAEQRMPQDGQISTHMEGRDIDIRAATIDSAYGEMVVLRILDKSRSLLEISQLGFLDDDLQKYREMLAIPYGLILSAGPTGSGKTTTLYASINELDRRQRNIVTIEDPIEYYFDDINQIQVNAKAGITFASGLRAMMRLDPDIILVGEMRDQDTANTGIQAALTGHLVLSSIHVNDAASAFPRLSHLGVESFYSASALVGVIAQRMVRKICPHCSVSGEVPRAENEAYEKVTGERLAEYQYGSGCNFCANTGFLGRTGVFEILRVSEQIRQMVIDGASTMDIRDQAIREGMRTMINDGMVKIREGITTPSEILRNIVSVK
ncbi:MAG: Flp pilus assembly complex ATPase component TadA [Dehalococcoidales bacterium]|nr:Flp pilus assembly complex ATPase component TadA [Dehalococcoidales bacterium]